MSRTKIRHFDGAKHLTTTDLYTYMYISIRHGKIEPVT
jgi:hypothetical protein